MTLTRCLGLDQLTEEEVKKYDKSMDYFRTLDTFLNEKREGMREALAVDYCMRQVVLYRKKQKYMRQR